MKKQISDYCSVLGHLLALLGMMYYFIISAISIEVNLADFNKLHFPLVISLVIAGVSITSLMYYVDNNERIDAFTCHFRIAVFHLTYAFMFAFVVNQLLPKLDIDTGMSLQAVPFFLSALLYGMNSYRGLLSTKVKNPDDLLFSAEFVFFILFCLVYLSLIRFAFVQATSSFGLVMMLAHTFRNIDGRRLEENMNY